MNRDGGYRSSVDALSTFARCQIGLGSVIKRTPCVGLVAELF